MSLYVGTSGYSYHEWKGSFYPEDLPQKRMLHFYSQHFTSVEINNTFHRMPTRSLLAAWGGEVPAEFRFILKAPQRITHQQRLKESQETLAYFLAVAAELQQRLAGVLFQLPPFLKKDLPRLAHFLALLPFPLRAAFDFRHQSWFEEEVFSLLREHNAALCIVDAEGELQVPRIATADWGYLRLRRPDYGEGELHRWLRWVQEQKWRDAFVFFKHEEEAKGVALARKFVALAAASP